MLRDLLPMWIVRNIWPDTPPKVGGKAPGDAFLEDNLPEDLNILAEIAKDPIHAIQILLRVGEPHIYITYDDEPEEHLVLAISSERHLMRFPDTIPGHRRQPTSWHDRPKVLIRAKDGDPYGNVTLREGPAITIRLTKETQAKLDLVTAKDPNTWTRRVNKPTPSNMSPLDVFMGSLHKVPFHIPVTLLKHPNRTGHLCRMVHSPHSHNVELLTRYGTFREWPHQVYGGDMLPVHGIEFEFVDDLSKIILDMKLVIDAANLTDAQLLSTQGFAEKVKTLKPFGRGDVVRTRTGEWSRLDGIVVKPADDWHQNIIVVVPADDTWKLIETLSGNFELVMTKEQADKITAGGKAMLGGLTPTEFVDKFYPEPEFEI